MNSGYEIKPIYLEKIQRFTLFDDTFMAKVFEDKECVELLLKIILKKELRVIRANSQLDVRNLQGRSVRLDIFAVDNDENYYNIEVQRADSGADPKRARYNGSVIDANITDPGDDMKKLPDCYVIFITEYDVLGGGLPLYTVNRRIEELDNRNFGDGSHIIYVNGEIKDDTALGKLMQDFACREAEKMNYKKLAERTGYFKNNDGGVNDMCKIMDELWQEGRLEGKIEIALNLIMMDKLSYEEIAQASGLPIEKIREIAASKPV